MRTGPRTVAGLSAAGLVFLAVWCVADLARPAPPARDAVRWDAGRRTGKEFARPISSLLERSPLPPSPGPDEPGARALTPGVPSRAAARPAAGSVQGQVHSRHDVSGSWITVELFGNGIGPCLHGGNGLEPAPVLRIEPTGAGADGVLRAAFPDVLARACESCGRASDRAIVLVRPDEVFGFEGLSAGTYRVRARSAVSPVGVTRAIELSEDVWLDLMLPEALEVCFETTPEGPSTGTTVYRFDRAGETIAEAWTPAHRPGEPEPGVLLPMTRIGPDLHRIAGLPAEELSFQVERHDAGGVWRSPRVALDLRRGAPRRVRVVLAPVGG